MVELTVVKCPRCGADLRSEKSDVNFFCRYCGAQIIAEKKTQYIREDPRRTELEKLKTLRVVEQDKVASLKTKKQEIEEELEAIEKNIESRDTKNMLGWVLSFFLFGAGIIGFLFAGPHFNEEWYLPCVTVALIPILIGLVFPYYYYLKGKNAYQLEYSEKKKEYWQVEYEIHLSLNKISDFEERIKRC
jgi:DNA-directed RNA polymerase subunit RPC12/RpoP